MRGLTGMRVLVTGGGRGIGRAVAERLLTEECQVTVADLAPGDGISGLSATLVGDVTVEEDAQRLVGEAQEAMGGLDSLVLCAGIHYVGPTHDMPAADFDRVVAVSLRGTFLVCKAALPSMLAAGQGRIVTFGSTAALVGAPSLSAYAAAKGAVLQFSRSIAAEYASRGIRVNCLCPGGTDTPMLRDLMKDRSDPQAFARAHPIGRFAQPEEIASAVTFLLSDDASYMVGSAMAFDGGFTAI